MQVKVTLGPRGRNVILEKPWFTDHYEGRCDGAKEIELEDKFENMGAQMVKESPPKHQMSLGTEPRQRPF